MTLRRWGIPSWASAVAAGVASFGCALTTVHGIPSLRHDWASPYYWNDWHQAFFAISGWQQNGIGSAAPYFVSSYFDALLVALGAATVGGRASLFLILTLIGAICAFAGRAVARDWRAGEVASSAAALFAALNPWVYTEVVAGHVFMILAYGASIWFWRELLTSRMRVPVIVFSLACMVQQLQFYVVAMTALALVAILQRHWTPLAIGIVLWLPALAGFAFDSQALAGVAYTLVWERSQSVAPLDALQLVGYFAHYDGAFGGPFAVPVITTFVLACIGAVVAWKRNAMIVAATVLVLVFAMGTSSFAGSIFAWGVEHVRLLALYRELYDVLAYAAVGYLFLAVSACGKIPWLRWMWALAICLLPLAWMSVPPERFWVPSGDLPSFAPAVGRNTRVLLLPAYQPMTFAGRGAGADPNYGVYPDNVTQLNVYLADYPVDAAISEYLLRNDVGGLQALSVSRILARPWLKTNAEAISRQRALPVRDTSALDGMSRELNAFPELSTVNDAGNADDPGVVAPVVAPNTQVDAAKGWVNARLAFASRPEIAQPFGGALTTNPNSKLGVTGGKDALVFVEGTLRAIDGSPLTRDTHGYRWILIPSAVSQVMCDGLCVVAAQGHPAAVPGFRSAERGEPIDFEQWTPWLVTALVPAGATATLRYNVQYDPHWHVLLSGVWLRHMRLEGIVNGWRMNARPEPSRLIIVQSVAALQFALQIISVAVLMVLLCGWLLQAARQFSKMRVDKAYD